MSKPKPQSARFKGKRLPDGRPVAHLGDYGLPAEALDEEAIAALTPGQIKILRDHPELYDVTEAPEPKASPKAKAAAGSDVVFKDNTITNAPKGGIAFNDTPAEPDEKGG